MKKEGSLKLILSVLIIVLLTLVSLGGFYLKDKNIWKNKIPEYKLGMELNSDTIIEIEPLRDNEEDSSEDTEDAAVQEGEEKTSEENKDESKENIYTAENYNKAKKIFEKRLKDANIEQYAIRLDKDNGNMVMEVPTSTDINILQNIFVQGKTEIRISETSEVLGDNNSIEKVSVATDDSYASYGIGSFVKIDVQFSKDAINKFKELKNNYVAPTDDQGNATQENSIEIAIDGTPICSLTESEFLNSAATGALPLKFGDYTTDKEKLNSILTEANMVKNLMQSEKLPVAYTVEYTNDLHSNINSYGIIAVFAVLFVVMAIYLIWKFKLNGVYSLLCILGFVSTLLLVIRYTNVQISIAAIVSIAAMAIVEFLYLVKILFNKKISKTVFNNETIEFSKMLIPVLIISTVIAFGSILEISGFGAVMFWGIILFEIFNNILTRAILTNGKNK